MSFTKDNITELLVVQCATPIGIVLIEKVL